MIRPDFKPPFTEAREDFHTGLWGKVSTDDPVRYGRQVRAVIFATVIVTILSICAAAWAEAIWTEHIAASLAE